MKPLLLLFIISTFLSCGTEKSLQLPEIKHAKIIEVHDVSHAYLFYDETQPDSVELNRKNIISTTNWLINVDKRLTLGQAIPKITYLQDKKRNAKMHKNEAAKNYYTCNDTSIQNLGFLEFTDVVYEIVNIENDSTRIQTLKPEAYHLKMASYHAKSTLSIIIYNDKSIKIGNEIISIDKFQKKINALINKYNFIGFHLEFYFNKKMTFQNYISIKSELLKAKSDTISFDNNEFIY